jgi:D-alanyl-D-alanine carboxypeptidase (penicillin-binding protein 5/6)
MKRLGCILILLALVFTFFPTTARAEAQTWPGKAYLLMDTATGTVLTSCNEHEALPPASVTKIMTLLLIMEAIDSGSLSWQDTVTASEAAAAKGGSQVYLKVGETMTVEEMVKSIAVSSANDCACAMAELLAGSESAFVEKMNQRARELGMNDTHFVNCTGLDDAADAADHKTSAHDIALMSRELLSNHPDIKKFTTIWMDSVRNGSFGLSNTNKLVRFYSGATGLKTGFTHTAGYCLSASAQRDGMELIAVVLGCESSQDRFDACRGMLDYGFANYAVYEAKMPDDPAVAVKLGKSPSVDAVPSGSPRLLVEKSKLSCVTTQITLEPQVTAPVTQGQRLGQLSVCCDGQTLAQIPLVARQGVERVTFADLFLELVQRAAFGKRAN